MRLAAIYASPEGRIFILAEMLEIHPKTLISQMSSQTPMSDNAINGISRILSPAELPELHKIKQIRG